MKGRWVEFDRAWHDTTVTPCAVCGRLIPRRAWVFDAGNGEIEACSESCEELYFSYVEPRYGTTKGATG